MASTRSRAAQTALPKDGAELSTAILDHLCYSLGRLPRFATQNDWYLAMSLTVRDLLLQRWINTLERLESAPRAVAYLSAEFLVGPHLANHLVNLNDLRGGRPVKQRDIFAVQLNDTHPSLAVAERMRLLMDERGM